MKDMEAKKEEDEANQVEGRESFDYSVPRRRKKVNHSQTNLEAIPENEDKKNEVDH